MTPCFTENKRGIRSKLVSPAIKLCDLNIFLVNKIQLLEGLSTLSWVQDYIRTISSHFYPKQDLIDFFCLFHEFAYATVRNAKRIMKKSFS